MKLLTTTSVAGVLLLGLAACGSAPQSVTAVGSTSPSASAGVSALPTPSASPDSDLIAPSPDAGVADAKKVVTDFYQLAFATKDPAKAAAQYMSTDYTEHDPTMADGTAVWVAATKAMLDAHSGYTSKVARVIVEGELVVLHTESSTGASGDRGQAGIDMYEVEDGKISEHWIARQDIPASTFSGNGMTDGPQPAGANGAELRSANKKSVFNLMTLAFAENNPTAATQYMDQDYVQHNPTVANGVAGFLAAFGGAPAPASPSAASPSAASPSSAAPVPLHNSSRGA